MGGKKMYPATPIKKKPYPWYMLFNFRTFGHPRDEIE